MEEGLTFFLEFSFTQKERYGMVKHCSLREDIKNRFRKIIPVGSDITVVFDKSEANKMMNALSRFAMDLTENNDLKAEFEDLHGRFELKYNDVFQ